MQTILQQLGLSETNDGAYCKGEIACSGPVLKSFSPIDNCVVAAVKTADEKSYERVISELQETFLEWRRLPAPKRGTVVRDMGEELRLYKAALGKLVTIEMGKILAEGEGEIQEAIDIAEFATGLSRQLYGLTMHSERPLHRMYEQWHPLGIV
ncbi:MAG: aldehyde dehydrogenase family protein, partial [Oligoflexia bacterium]|nr:aldehyde dehydrogenase family protein [Oligoflexia bacterium]